MCKKRIAIFSDNLQVGGIQKSLANIIIGNAFKEYEVDVFLYNKEIFFDLSNFKNNIHLHFLTPMPYWTKGIPFDILYRLYTPDQEALKEEYELAIDFDSYQNATALGALKAKAKKRVMWIHNDVEIKRREERKYRLLWSIMKGKYKYFDEFAAVSEGIVEPFRKSTGLSDAKIHVIPNLINTEEIHTRSNEPIDLSVNHDTLNIVSVGRLCHQKGYDLMLKSISEVYDKRKDIACYIIGDGPDKDSLVNQSIELGIDKIVHFTGNLPNPFPVIKQMDVFCLESRYEGQGMVLWEAKALGLELIFAKRLEKYNPQLKGTEDIVSALVSAQKKEKQLDNLDEYNNIIISRLQILAK